MKCLNLKEIPIDAMPSKRSRTRDDFLCLLFRSLDEVAVRYCVLHSWEELPENLSSDLDLAVHPHDVPKLPLVFRILSSNGYRPLQLANYAMGGYRFDFAWFETSAMSAIAVDITCGYVEGGLILISGDALVAMRQRRRNFWIADAATEFAYLLVRRTSKGSLSGRQAERLKCLAEEIGRAPSEQIAGGLFGKRHKARVIEACTRGHLGELLPALRTQLWWTILKRDPLNPIRCALANGLRLIRRWLEPSGIVVVFLGPDGVGKSTAINCLVQVISPAFRGHRVFHYRPMLLWPGSQRGAVTNPHGRSQRSTWGSFVQLLVHVLDYWFGYWLILRPLLARSGLVIFDRYFYDLFIDPRRYRYAGPLWAARLVSALVPRPDLIFALAAPAKLILSRKQEVTPEEVERQERVYLSEATEFLHALVIDTTVPVAEVGAEAAQAIAEYLDYRFQSRYARWLALGEGPEQAQNLERAPGVRFTA